MNLKDIDHRFTYHPPADAATVGLHEQARAKVRNVARWMETHVPAGRELALVHTHLEQAVMWANAGIARSAARNGSMAPSESAQTPRAAPVASQTAATPSPEPEAAPEPVRRPRGRPRKVVAAAGETPAAVTAKPKAARKR